MDRRNDCLRLLDMAEKESMRIYDALPQDAKDEHGTFEHWAPKDLIAHIAAWVDFGASGVESFRERTTWRASEDFETHNQEIFDRYEDMTWGQAVEFLAEAFERMRSATQALSNDELLDPFEVRDGETRPVWRLVVGYAYTHPINHITARYVEREDSAAAAALQEEMVEHLVALDQDPEWQSIPIYNLGCFYSLSGKSERAIEEIRRALRLNPDLRDWSMKDPDLEPVRDHPDFQALFDA